MPSIVYGDKKRKKKKKREKKFRNFHTFCEEEIAEPLPKSKNSKNTAQR